MLPCAEEQRLPGRLRACAESLLHSSGLSCGRLVAGDAPLGPVTGRGWPLFRRLSRSVHGDTTGSKGGSLPLCTDGTVARISARARVVIGLDDAWSHGQQ